MSLFPLVRLRHGLARGVQRALMRLFVLRSRRAMRTWARWSAFFAAVFIGWIAASTYWLFYSPHAQDEGYPHWHARRVVPLVEDASGRLVGLWPWAGVVGEKLDDNEYLAAAPVAVPAPWWRMVVLLEDGNRDRWYHFLGIDWSQFIKIPLHLVSGGGLRGGSTLEMQLIKTLNMDTDARGVVKLGRKLRDLAQAPAFALALSEAELSRWVAAHFPLIDAGPHGLEAAARLLFARSGEDLTLAQQAVLAAAIKRRVRLNPHDPTRRAKAQRLWRGTLARARLGLERLHREGDIDEGRLRAALDELSAMNLPDLAPDPGLAQCLQRRTPLERDLAARKLNVRALYLAQSELRQVDGELRPYLGRDWPSRVALIRLTLDRDANCRDKWRLEEIKTRWTRRLGLDSKDVALVVAVADERGRLIRFRADSAYPRYLPYRPEPDGYRIVPPAQDVREMGSIAKAFAALLAGREGDTPQSRYYRLRRARYIGRYPYQTRQWYQNAGGFTGFEHRDTPGAAITAAEAFAHSDNLAVMERLDRIDGLALQAQALLTAFGLRPPIPFDPVESLALGNIHAAPQSIHGLFALLARPNPGAEGLGDCRPTLIEDLQARSGQEEAVASALRRQRIARRTLCITARRWLQKAPAAVAFAQEVLAAVLDPARRGTASAHLAEFRRHGPLRLPLSIAKTGTVALQDGRSRWVWLAGALRTADGRHYSYVAHAGPMGDRRHHLGRHATGGQLGAFIAPLLQPLTQKDNRP